MQDKTMKKKVSIIIPCYNSESHINDCIQSVLRQDYENIEVIVVDDGSSDNSLKVLSQYENDITIITQKNQGACVARNRGLSLATGEYIKFLDSDDYLANNIISSQAEQMDNLSEDEIVYGNYTLVYPEIEKLHKNKKISKEFTTEELINSDILTSTPLHRKKLLEKINGFDPRFKHGQEWNLHVRLAAAGVKFIYSPENVYFYRIHDAEERISNKKKFDPDYEFEKCMMTLKSIETFHDISPSILTGMASRIWGIGRACLASSSKNKANYYFSYASKLSDTPTKYCALRYRFLYSILGASISEKIISIIRRKNIFRV